MCCSTGIEYFLQDTYLVALNKKANIFSRERCESDYAILRGCATKKNRLEFVVISRHALLLQRIDDTQVSVTVKHSYERDETLLTYRRHHSI